VTGDRRVALVTGSSRGIGRGIALRLAADGAGVAVHYATRRDDALAVVGEITAAGGRAAAFGGDVGDADAVEALFAGIESELGSVDVLVNNAGAHRGGRLHRVSADDLEFVLRTTVTGAFRCAQRALPAMLDQGWGRIVNISSVVARRGSPGDVVYAAAKSGLLGLSRSLAAEVARSGVTVNAILPGLVLTEMTLGLSPKAQERNIAMIPMGRDGQPEEVGGAVAYLVSDDAAYVTGVELPVDGGMLV
jgi:3-oxoacyl-[acyl-carrier protein] reductase